MADTNIENNPHVAAEKNAFREFIDKTLKARNQKSGKRLPRGVTYTELVQLVLDDPDGEECREFRSLFQA